MACDARWISIFPIHPRGAIYSNAQGADHIREAFGELLRPHGIGDRPTAGPEHCSNPAVGLVAVIGLALERDQVLRIRDEAVGGGGVDTFTATALRLELIDQRVQARHPPFWGVA